MLDRLTGNLSLVLTDRTGYVRRVQSLESVADLIKYSFSDVTPSLEQNQLAPEFTILDSTGREVRLADFRGRKNVLLTFFPKCFTDG